MAPKPGTPLKIKIKVEFDKTARRHDQTATRTRRGHPGQRVSRALLNWVKLGTRIPGASTRPVEVNGAPGALVLDGDERLIAVWALEVGQGQIQGVSSIINPEKLVHLGPVADLKALLCRRGDRRHGSSLRYRR